MIAGELDALLAGLKGRRVLVVSDRYPPDDAGGAELSLHLLLREPALRDEVVVATFDKALARPARRSLDGVEVIALPAPAAWPLHRLSQAAVERLKRRPLGLKWPAYWRDAAGLAIRDPATHGRALALRLRGLAPPGGLAMDHATIPGGGMERAFGELVARLRPRLVHADNARAIVAAAGALESLPIPLVALVRDHRFTSPRFDQTFGPLDGAAAHPAVEALAADALAFRRRRLARADLIVATSRHLAGTLRGVAPEGRLAQAPLAPVELPEAAPAPDRAEGFTILLVGALTEKKGQTHLLAAWPRIAAAIPDARIEIAGSGPDEAALRRLIAAHGANDRIELHGRLAGAALARLYRAADVVALPTLWSEPFGRVPLEAGAFGRAVVAYASGGLAETVADGVTGRLVRTGDVEAFVAALADLAADPAARAAFGSAGRARALRDHSPAALAELLRALWERAASSSGSSVRSP